MSPGSLERLFPIPSFRRKEVAYPEQEFYEQILEVYRAWDTIEKRGTIIDFDLTAGPKNYEKVMRKRKQEPTPDDRDLMVEAVDELLQRVQEITPSSKEHQHNLTFLNTRIEASSWVARRLRGDDLNPIMYIEKTNGVKAEPTSNVLLMALKDKALESAKQAHVPTADDQSYMAWRIDN